MIDVVHSYLGSARYHDLLDVGLRCTRIGTSSVLFSAAVFSQDRLLATGELVYVFTETHAPAPQPQALRDALMADEAGDAMFDVKAGGWGELGVAARAIHTEVFVDEHTIPVAMEWDEADAGGMHAVAFNRFGVPLATGRLLAHGPDLARVGRMATRQAVRGSGIARGVLNALMAAAKERGDTEVLLHAQLSAQAFYARAGFVPRGPVFHEAGIAHIEMSRTL